MSVEPWYKVVTPRPEVREGRSFNPDEFAIALEQVVAGNAPEDYRDPTKFFSRTVFTRALREHLGVVLRRLAGQTEDTSAVLTLVTQFGGGKTHTLTALYHLAKNPGPSSKDAGVRGLLFDLGLSKSPEAKVAVLVGNAWDPKEGRETPWIDVARQLAGDAGVAALGPKAKTSPPGTEALAQLFKVAGGKVLVLFDEVLNLINRHRDLADPFHAFLQNLTVAMTGTTNSAAVISLPRSQVELTEHDRIWQEKINKIVRRVARELIANDEGEIAEVIRRRLFENFSDKDKKKIREASEAYADWCFERRAQLPPEWTTVDTATKDTKAKEQLRARFEACYPFHPATLSVFQRKWQTLAQYQQTRGTLSMLAQWVSWVFRESHQKARAEGFIGLGSAPLENPSFRATVLGQLGESRLIHAIETDIAGPNAHARALDAGVKGQLESLHRRVAVTMLFESSGGMASEKAAHLPELRFAVGEPGMDTTSVDTAATALESRCFYLRKVGRDGYRFGFKPTLRKVVGDRRASLDEGEVRKAEQEWVRKEFEKGATMGLALFPKESSEVADPTKLTLAVLDPERTNSDARKKELASWTRERGKNNARLYPGALVWCVRRDGTELRERVEELLAWRQVSSEIASGAIGGDFETAERNEVGSNIRDAESQLREEIWASYRFVAVYDPRTSEGLHVIDLGAGHSSAGETLSGRALAALRNEGLLNENVGAGYLERNWPTALKEGGTWPLAGLRKSFLDGSLTRLPDPETILKSAIPRLVEKGEFGLASGQRKDGSFNRIWFKEPIDVADLVFDAQTFLILKTKAAELKAPESAPAGKPTMGGPPTARSTAAIDDVFPTAPIGAAILALKGSLPPEAWNKLGVRLVPLLKKGSEIKIAIAVSATAPPGEREAFERDVRRVLRELGLNEWSVEIVQAAPKP